MIEKVLGGETNNLIEHLLRGVFDFEIAILAVWRKEFFFDACDLHLVLLSQNTLQLFQVTLLWVELADDGRLGEDSVV